MIRRIDWTQLINDILNSDRDISISAIARKVGVDKSSIVRLRICESEPKYYTGDALIKLWRRKTNQPKANPPTLMR
ncbi:MAG: hypothetical protein [Caudoviricetes sp.]|nr:MAG: hypothetical protein [Caudoviricetes sp.]